MLDPTYPLFPVLAFLGFVLALIPLPWHLQAWNAGTCAYMIWSSLACLIAFIDSIIWRDTAINVAPVWCDIASKFSLGAGIGIPAASLCISRRLYYITGVRNVSVTREDKRRALIYDILIAAGIPVLVMILHYVVQGHRFNILENIGCYPHVFLTLPAFFLVYIWPVVLGCISFVYSAFTLRTFWKRRLQFNEFLLSNSAMSVSRYVRLMLLAMTEMACTVPIGIYNTHFHFSNVNLIPAVIWRSDPASRVAVEMTRWLFPACALLFFVLFGFATEAQKNYHRAFWWIVKPFGFKPKETGPKPPIMAYAQGKKTPTSNFIASSCTPPAYTCSNDIENKCRIESFTPSFGETDLSSDADLEKVAGLPLTSNSWLEDLSARGTSITSSYYTSSTSVHTIRRSISNSSISAVIGGTGPDANSGGKGNISVSEINSAHNLPSPRPPSPAPSRAGPTVPFYHRPFSPPSVYPVVYHHPSAQRTMDGGGIHVTIHKQSTTSF